MKIALNFCAITILFSPYPANAYDYDNMHMGSVPAHSTKEVVAKLPAVEAKIDVRATNDAPITCTFLDSITGAELAKQEHVPFCAAIRSPPPDVKPGEYVVQHQVIKITNDNDQDIDYRVWTHSIK